MKIVINDCFGGFGLSDQAIEHYAKVKKIELIRRDATWRTNGYDYYYADPQEYFSPRDIPRDDPALVQTVQDLGDEANDFASELKIVEVPDGVDWQIQDYDGIEWVAETHRTWR